ncbi:DUF916 domain-containing protein [Kineosporia sp. J2-2]|uniref:DUF916 domain-containing protein n=1 Tax=Kineosporia corallincola TaxID=2835133 RepID=A0ABS5T940_9ACTN|nr:DUF916 domain-containing protein [Kineosporia corallincola]MBT0767590.1 DUF916 domain-containing protein [Kineosporia corallincola]
MRPVKMLAAAALTLATLTGTLAGAGVAHAAPGAGDDVTWTVRTASNDFGDSRTSFAYDMKPGATLDDAMVVANRGSTPLTLNVYAADGFTTEAGQMDLVTKDAESTGVGAWVHAEKSSVTVKPGKTAELPFTVTVPENATPGDHAGGLITSLVQADSTETISVDRRLGIQVRLRVDGDLTPSFAIEDLKVDYDGGPLKGDADVSYTIRNTGNAILSGRGTASVEGPFGWFQAVGDEQGTPQQLLPGETWTVSGQVHGVVPAVRLTATATLLPVITDAAGSSTTLEPVTATTHAWVIPWIPLVALVVLILLVVAGIRLTRHRRAQRLAREDARVAEAVQEALRVK